MPEAFRSPEYLLFISGIILIASALYASVGHGGGSAYLAIMGLSGLLPSEMKPISLTLNISVSALAFFHFSRQGHFQCKLFLPLIATSIPTAFVGGWLEISDALFKTMFAVSLIFAAWKLSFSKPAGNMELREVKSFHLLWIGGLIGLVSGLIGIGGGIFLTPILILMGWAETKTAAAISAAFIVINSCSGLSGLLLKGGEIPMLTLYFIPCVIIGGWLGARWGSTKAASTSLRRALSAVLLVAAAKFLIV